ncbi:MAG TPA: hypothetical protein PLS46_00380 [Microthrixaceae bacterium]|nr:hypothetical protein [Microthrixaceae bacterium]
MSTYEWERAELKLPSAAVSPLKKLLRDWVNVLHDEVRAESLRVHDTVGNGTRSAKIYAERLTAHRREVIGRTVSRYSMGVDRAERCRWVELLACDVIEAGLRSSSKPHKPTVADVSKVVPRATASTTTFEVLGEEGFTTAWIRFDGRTVIWNVSENNHAIDHAHNSPLAGVFFGALAKVVWTRGSGGVGYANDEYNREDRGCGGGANYRTFEFGPNLARWASSSGIPASTRSTSPALETSARR